MEKDVKTNNIIKVVGGAAFGYGIYKGMKAKKEKGELSDMDAIITVLGMFALLIGFVGLNKA